MLKGFEGIDEVEMAELGGLFKLLEKHVPSDNGRIFAAQLMGARRLVVSQQVAQKELIEGQAKSHQELLAEQRNIIWWQRWVTICTIAITAATIYYTVTTRQMLLANVEPLLSVGPYDVALKDGKGSLRISNSGGVAIGDIQIWKNDFFFPLKSNSTYELSGHATRPFLRIPHLNPGEGQDLSVDIGSEIQAGSELMKTQGTGVNFATVRITYRHGITAKKFDSSVSYLMMPDRLMRMDENPTKFVEMARSTIRQYAPTK